MLPAKPLVAEFREPVVSLWLGPNAHLVLYPVRGGDAVNLVAIVRDDWNAPGWSAPGAPEELLAHYRRWPPRLKNLLALPDRWLKWALYDRTRLRRWFFHWLTVSIVAVWRLFVSTAQRGRTWSRWHRASMQRMRIWPS